MRKLILILGDQLAQDSPALENIDPAQDCVLMIESVGEARYVWSHQARIALFLAAMRHHADWLRAQGWPVDYRALADHAHADLCAVLREALQAHRPQRLVMVEPGEWRLAQAIRATAEAVDVTLQMLDDTHFLISRHAFADWARGYKQLRMEFFYRFMRKRLDVLMEGDQPVGGRWNFDAENRKGFGRAGPGWVPPHQGFAPDATTRAVLDEVATRFADHPGSLAHFDWPVTRTDALAALSDFVQHRLVHFGTWQDAMWRDAPVLYHARLSAAMNLKLLSPREVVEAALAAWRAQDLPLAGVEGFVRQVIGWREFIRGVYWLDMPAMREANHFGHTRDLPRWYWTGETHMHCMRQVIGQTLDYAYAHHIQRLMVTGMFAMLAEVAPQQVEDWYLAVYVDAVEWVELPNVAGMALYANGGRFTSKPYAASGAYVSRMSNYCEGCRYQPDQRTGTRACPLTTLYWHFLDRHEAALANEPRTALMVKNLGRLPDAEREAIRAQAERVLARLDEL